LNINAALTGAEVGGDGAAYLRSSISIVQGAATNLVIGWTWYFTQRMALNVTNSNVGDAGVIVPSIDPR
jgi:hypothetical protein